MKKISEDKRRKRNVLKENCCPIRSQLETQKKKKLDRLSLHKNWTWTFVLRVLVCFSWHIVLMFRALFSCHLLAIVSHWFKSSTTDLHDQLRAADSRCELLDKQLDYMRKMLGEAEAEKRLAYERSEQMSRLRNANTGQEMRVQMEKISEMEREHHRLQASQVVAQVCNNNNCS